MKEFSKYVGLDTHKETIAVAVADAMGGKARYYGEIANTPEAIKKLVKDVKLPCIIADDGHISWNSMP